METIKKIFRRGWTNFQRHRYLSAAATGVMALALLLFLGLLSLQFLTTQIVAGLQDKVDISAYFKADAAEDTILKAKNELSARPEVASVIYVSRDQALADFKIRHAQEALVQESLAQLDDNPLEASLNIKTRESSQYASLADWLNTSQYKTSLDKISFYENKTIIDRIDRVAGAIRNWGLSTALLIAVVAVMVAFTTVRLTIFNQRQEIEIMRLVGASNWHIRGPYLAEGGFYGTFAAMMALVIFYPLAYLVSGKISGFFETGNLFSYLTHGVLQIVGLTLGTGIFLGVVSSFMAIRRHLKI